MPNRIAIAIVGLGKIARDSHGPALRANPRFDFLATVDPTGATLDDISSFESFDALVSHGPTLDAVAVCTPPVARAAIARRALEAGLDVLLEKPPAATLGELDSLRRAADAGGCVLFAAWHSRFAPMVSLARAWADERTIVRGAMRWREDARKWHPGQKWLWEPGGLGVFDPAINGLSILTAILAAPIEVRAATFDVPEGAQTPIAASLTLASGEAEISCGLSFREQRDECWEIDLEDANGGRLKLAAGGHALSIDGEPITARVQAEYPMLYARFAGLIAARESDADDAPLRVVADAHLIALTRMVEPFSA